MPNHAIVIGINEYPGISNLKGPCNDARAFLEWVQCPGPGNVEPTCAHTLFSTDFPSSIDIQNAKPVSDQIADKFEEIIDGNPIQHIGDRLYVFVAGHGMSDVNHAESAAVIAANATRKGITIPHVVVTDYIQYFRRSYTFKEIILIMDCCLDATVLRPLNVTGFLQGNPHPNASKVCMFTANATVWSKKSFEKQYNGMTRGIFSVALMEALAQAPSEGGKVTGKAIRNYIDQHIKKIGGDQEIEIPTIGGREYENIVFYERNNAQTVEAETAITITVRITPSSGNEVVDLFDGDRVLKNSKVVETGSVTFRVAAGIYKVAIRDTDRQSLIEVVRDHEEKL